MTAVRKLSSSQHIKVWGSQKLSPWYPDSPDQKIGEVWFDPPADVPLLVKFLFTTENLSVQVHPNDDYARVHHAGSNGKTEMWYILRADPGAKIALGLTCDLKAEELRDASRSGAIMDLLNWVEAVPGQIFFVPAGTIHAIGAGIALCEVQQISDVTYRLYDYGRDRELHLDHGVTVSDLTAFQPADLATCQYFRTSVVEVPSEATFNASTPSILICVSGQGTLDGHPYRAGEAWHVSGAEVHLLAALPSRFLLTSVPTRYSE